MLWVRCISTDQGNVVFSMLFVQIEKFGCTVWACCLSIFCCNNLLQNCLVRIESYRLFQFFFFPPELRLDRNVLQRSTFSQPYARTTKNVLEVATTLWNFPCSRILHNLHELPSISRSFLAYIRKTKGPPSWNFFFFLSSFSSSSKTIISNNHFKQSSINQLIKQTTI